MLVILFIFIVYSMDDQVVLVENSICLYQLLVDYGVLVEMYLYEFGGYGYGMVELDEMLFFWMDCLLDWLKGWDIWQSKVLVFIKLLDKQGFMNKRDCFLCVEVFVFRGKGVCGG